MSGTNSAQSTVQERAARNLVDFHRQIDATSIVPAGERGYWKELISRRLERVGVRLAQRGLRARAADWARQGLPAVPAVLRQEVVAEQMALIEAGLPAAAANAARPSRQLEQLVRAAVAPGAWDVPANVLAQQLPPMRGPLVAAPPAPGAAPAANDYGDELVELIQTTIAPTTWDVNGGVGTIRYFRNLRVLVVRQTDETHEALGGLLGGLRQ
jgi:hypothetical protein